jgi:anti-sigma-K factor RskA
VNIKEYISSGILESYALGELTPSERLEVEKNLAQYPELRAELALVEETMEAFLMKAGEQPGAEVKEKIMASIEKPEAKVVSLFTWRYATAASVVIALTATYMALTFYYKWQHSEKSLLALQAQNEQFASDYNQVNQRLNAIETEMQIMSNPAFERVIMKGTPNAPEALASVYWNKNSQEVYLSIQNLKALAKEQQYQLWAIVDGKPVDMGVFDSPTSGTALAGLMKMKTTSKAAAFAVTIEPRGGKSSPSLETMQVLGNI